MERQEPPKRHTLEGVLDLSVVLTFGVGDGYTIEKLNSVMLREMNMLGPMNHQSFLIAAPTNDTSHGERYD